MQAARASSEGIPYAPTKLYLEGTSTAIPIVSIASHGRDIIAEQPLEFLDIGTPVALHDEFGRIRRGTIRDVELVEIDGTPKLRLSIERTALEIVDQNGMRAEDTWRESDEAPQTSNEPSHIRMRPEMSSDMADESMRWEDPEQHLEYVRKNGDEDDDDEYAASAQAQMEMQSLFELAEELEHVGKSPQAHPSWQTQKVVDNARKYLNGASVVSAAAGRQMAEAVSRAKGPVGQFTRRALITSRTLLGMTPVKKQRVTSMPPQRHNVKTMGPHSQTQPSSREPLTSTDRRLLTIAAGALVAVVTVYLASRPDAPAVQAPMAATPSEAQIAAPESAAEPQQPVNQMPAQDTLEPSSQNAQINEPAPEPVHHAPQPSYEQGRIPPPSYPTTPPAVTVQTPHRAIPQTSSPYAKLRQPAMNTSTTSATKVSVSAKASTEMDTTIRDIAAKPAQSKVLFGTRMISGGRSFSLRLSQAARSIEGMALSDGFSVNIMGALSLDRAGPIKAAYPNTIDQARILNHGDHAELTIRFRPGVKPLRYRVALVGNMLEITLGPK